MCIGVYVCVAAAAPVLAGEAASAHRFNGAHGKQQQCSSPRKVLSAAFRSASACTTQCAMPCATPCTMQYATHVGAAGGEVGGDAAGTRTEVGEGVLGVDAALNGVALCCSCNGLQHTVGMGMGLRA